MVTFACWKCAAAVSAPQEDVGTLAECEACGACCTVPNSAAAPVTPSNDAAAARRGAEIGRARQRTPSALWRDVLIGGGGGLLLAAAWALLLYMIADNASHGSTGLGFRARFRTIAFMLGTGALVVLGGVAGNAVADTPGAYIGMITAYVVPFTAYGIWVQRTVGWDAWFSSWKESKRQADRQPTPAWVWVTFVVIVFGILCLVPVGMFVMMLLALRGP